MAADPVLDNGHAVVRVLENNVPRMNDSWESAKHGEDNVDQEFQREAHLDEDGEGRNEKGQDGQQKVGGDGEGRTIATADLSGHFLLERRKYDKKRKKTERLGVLKKEESRLSLNDTACAVRHTSRCDM